MPALVFEIEGELWAQPVPHAALPGNQDRGRDPARRGHRSQGRATDGPAAAAPLRGRTGLHARHGPGVRGRVPQDRRPARPRQHRGRRPLCRAAARRLRVPDRAHPAQDGGGVPDLHAVAAADGLSALPGADAVDGDRQGHAGRRRCKARRNGVDAAGRHRAAQPARHRGPDQLRVPHRARACTCCRSRSPRPSISAPRPAVAALGLPDTGGAKAAIRLRLRTTGGVPIGKLALERLSFFLGGPEGAAHAALRAALGPGHRRSSCGPATRPLPWQDRLPRARAAARRLRAETRRCCRARPHRSTATGCCRNTTRMPERFLFFNLAGLDRAAIRCASPDIEIIILLDRSEPALAGVRPGPHAAQLHAGDQPVPQAQRPRQPRPRATPST